MGATCQPRRTTAFLEERSPGLLAGTIAFDGERSCAGVGRRDRFVTNAIARRRPPRRSLLLAGPRATHDRKGDKALVRIEPDLRPVHDRFRPGTRVLAKDPTGVLGPVDVN
jgi:hypothetical protein